LTLPVWHPAYVGLGSNLENPLAQVRRAIAELAEIADTRVVATSHLYRSKPLGPADQPDYVNAVAGLLTQLAPGALLDAMQAIERRHGRDRSVAKWGPRTLDLDLLLYSGCELRDEALVLPHPHMHERAFVLVPLAEIAPAAVVPGHGRVQALAAHCERDGLGVLEQGDAAH
jgi:2-amino-4-hydroxy-6-hydroxymethyldihydropteridine diphosphokinase